MGEEVVTGLEKEISDLMEMNKELEEKLNKANMLINDLFDGLKLLFNALGDKINVETLLRLKSILKEKE